MKIFILEDNLQNCESYRDMLDSIDADIAVCHTAAEKPLHALVHFQPDVVLLDLDLSQAFAEIVLGFIHSYPRLANTKVIIIADDKQIADYTTRYWGVNNTWLHKPALKDQLPNVIGTMCSVS
jgi:response regulator RpfG family c-di-GMP phosphodiesterase